MEFIRGDQSLKTLVDSDGNLYRENPDGSVSFGDVARNLLGQQCQYASRYIDGRVRNYPKLGNGLRFTELDSSSYHDIGIHPEDIEEFRRRFEAWGAYKVGYIHDPEGNLYELSEGDKETLRQYLENVGAFGVESAAQS